MMVLLFAALHVVSCSCGDVSGGFVHAGGTVVGTVLAETMRPAIVHDSSISSANGVGRGRGSWSFIHGGLGRIGGSSKGGVVHGSVGTMITRWYGL